MDITIDHLRAIMPAAVRAAVFIDPLNEAMSRFGIDTPTEQASFLAQVAHESQQLMKVRENMNYSADRLTAVWPRRFPPDLAKQLAYKPEQIANVAYASRFGNGDAKSGDGWRFRGGGLLGLTFRDNYVACGNGIGVPLGTAPERIAEPEIAALTAGWFWKSKGIERFSDDLDVRDETHIINGGEFGLRERQAFFDKAITVLA